MSIGKLYPFAPGASFEYQKKIYNVKSCDFVSGKYLVKTNVRTFVFFESEFDAFVQEIRFIDNADKKIVTRNEPYKAEIVGVNSRSLRIADKLEEVFNEISNGDFDEGKLKKAHAMVNISNAIVANEVLNLRFLALKNK